MTSAPAWTPTHSDPLFILAMDHRGSFGSSLFGVKDESPTAAQAAAMRQAKDIIFRGLALAAPQLGRGRAGVLVDEQYGQQVIDDARQSAADETTAPIVLAVPVEASGHDWFTLQWGQDWLKHVEAIAPDYAKVLVRDNPDFDPGQRAAQLSALHEVSAGLDRLGVPLLYELLVPATKDQLARVGGDAGRYDRELRPDLVVAVMAENQAHEIEPTLWKVEGLDTVAATQHVADQAGVGGRSAQMIVLGRDAPADRLNHWLANAAAVERFVGFAIGRSIWEDVIADQQKAGSADGASEEAAERIAAAYLGFVAHWSA